jgi:hypothetical protein
MWRLRRASLIAALAVAAIGAGYYADICGEATLDVPGVVLNTEEDSVPEYTRYESRNVHTIQSLVSIPGQTFWWPHSFSVGARVTVGLIEGRFSGHRYITYVSPTEP